jgi:uncharacterized membrane protein (DUF2068 family)
MFDAVEVLLVSLAVVLGGAAFAIGTQLIRAAWHDARPAPPPKAPPVPADLNPLPLRGIATLEALKALAVLAATWGLLAFASHPTWLSAASAIVGHFGVAAREQQAVSSFGLRLASERAPLLVGAAGYAALHLVEAWGLWRLRPWGEALGAASGAVYLPFEIGHLLHRPSWPTASLLMLNLMVVAYLVWRLRLRTVSAR